LQGLITSTLFIGDVIIGAFGLDQNGILEGNGYVVSSSWITGGIRQVPHGLNMSHNQIPGGQALIKGTSSPVTGIESPQYGDTDQAEDKDSNQGFK